MPTGENEGLTEPLTHGLGGAGQSQSPLRLSSPSCNVGETVEAICDGVANTELVPQVKTLDQVSLGFLQAPLRTFGPAKTLEGKSRPLESTLATKQLETVLEMASRCGRLFQR